MIVRKSHWSAKWRHFQTGRISIAQKSQSEVTALKNCLCLLEAINLKMPVCRADPEVNGDESATRLCGLNLLECCGQGLVLLLLDGPLVFHFTFSIGNYTLSISDRFFFIFECCFSVFLQLIICY